MALAVLGAMAIRDYRELHAWAVARELADRIATLAQQRRLAAPRRLIEQVTGASQSVCANIAEGFGRYSPGDFIRFLRIAKGSALEVQQHLHEAQHCGWISADEARELHTLTRRIVGSIVPLIKYLETLKR